MQAAPGTAGWYCVDAMKTKTGRTPTALLTRRKPIVMEAKIDRVITRPYLPSSEERIRKVINRVLSLDEEQAGTMLETLLQEFSHRHRYFRESLERNFERVVDFVPDDVQISKQRRHLIGAYFTAEYSVEAAALFNPSIVQVPGAGSRRLLPICYELPFHR